MAILYIVCVRRILFTTLLFAGLLKQTIVIDQKVSDLDPVDHSERMAPYP